MAARNKGKCKNPINTSSNFVTSKKQSKGNDSNLDLKRPSSSEKSKTPSRNAVILLLAIVIFHIHTHHVSTLFENDRHFSHLSTLEREMTFRSEMGLYYSYYKTLVEAPTFLDGFNSITHDNLTEYPNTINTLERFNLFPEVILGCLYRIFDFFCDWFNISGKQCWEIERGAGLSPVTSCEGIRQPEYFYLGAVWTCAGLTAVMIFLYGILLSDSVLGGLISVICFFYNHGESTRVQWTPPLRESFAYPFCLMQMYCVSKSLYENKRTNDETERKLQHKVQFVTIALTTSLSLTMWQFSQFLFATQVLAILLLFMFGFISKFSAMMIFTAQMLGLTQTLFFMFGNELLLSSLFTCLLLAASITLTFLYPVLSQIFRPSLRNILTTWMIFTVTVILKTRALTTNDDAHIINILRSKVSPYHDFHTLLYTCSPEFDFLGWEPIIKLTETGLIPVSCFVLITLFLQWLTCTNKTRSIDPHICYNILQLGAFTIMALMIMRLKLFFTPHLCIIASLVASSKYIGKGSLDKKYHYPLLVVLVGCMTVVGLKNFLDQRKILGEYSNVAMEELLNWISTNTNKNAVFAGPMPVTAAILLSTRRPIVNHPHYEDAQLRERTKKVYSSFSRKTPDEVFKILSSMEVEYLVISDVWCYGQNRPGCSMTDLWDLEDSENRNNPPTCQQLAAGNFPFFPAFSNEKYAVLKLQPPYVELKGFNKY